jgi:hypothetical protein
MALSDGDWIEGKVRPWWKYVIPAETQFWTAILNQRASMKAGPQPDPWRRAQSLSLEAVAMLQAVASIADAKERTSILSEAGELLRAAELAVRNVEAGQPRH